MMGWGSSTHTLHLRDVCLSRRYSSFTLTHNRHTAHTPCGQYTLRSIFILHLKHTAESRTRVLHSTKMRKGVGKLYTHLYTSLWKEVLDLIYTIYLVIIYKIND